jgi:ribosomal protein S11
MDQGRKERALSKAIQEAHRARRAPRGSYLQQHQGRPHGREGQCHHVFSQARSASPAPASHPVRCAKVGELLGEKGAHGHRPQGGTVIIRGVGAGRESALRAFSGKGIQIRAIKDKTPVPHNGPRPPKPRRV